MPLRFTPPSASTCRYVAKASRRASGRRSGQALLLAVLLMVFAALLGSTFITIVALNLNQTARQENLSGARVSTQAAMTFINDKLTNSTEGTNWRPEMVSSPPTVGDADFNRYYTAFERAQGWTRTIEHPADATDADGDTIPYKTGATITDPDEDWIYISQKMRDFTDVNLSNYRCYVKFPDPRGLPPQVNAPQYLVEVRPQLLPDPTTVSKFNTDGKIKISVIGQSEDDPNVFVSRTAYKDGVTQNPIVSVARTVTNWDFVNNVVPSAQVDAPPTGAAPLTLTLKNVRGIMPAAPFYLMIGNPGGGALKNALVTLYNPATKTCTLSQAIALPAVPNERVEVAAALGSPTFIDYGNQATGAAAVARNQVAYRTGENTDLGGLRINGSLALIGNFLAHNVNGTTPAARMMVSGLIAPRNTTHTSVPPSVPANIPHIAAPKVSIQTAPATVVNYDMVASDNNDFPLIGAVPNEAQMVQDGRDRLLNVSSGNRTVQNYVPGLLNTSNTNRYRELTQFSRSLDPAKPSAALFGYGEGIYIDNIADRERITDASGVLREMTDTDLRKMIFDDTPTTAANTATSAQRQARPYGVDALAAGNKPSLEQRHLRGWTARDEFRPRGVLLELDPRRQKIYITRDELSDITSALVAGAASGDDPDVNKLWRDKDGAPMRGVYRQELDWPKNGVIFAEGNVLVRNADSLNDTPRSSLTIVSMNNIYIQGSVNAGTTTAGVTRKLLLLAKRNIIANPTALMSRPIGQTIALPHAATAAIPVADISLFRAGDWVQVNNTFRRVLNLTTTSVILDQALTAKTLEERIRIVGDPTFTNGVAYFANATRIGRSADSLQRRFQSAANAPAARFVFRHSAERKNALKVKAEPGQPTQTYIDISNKFETAAIPASPIAPTTLIQGANKTIRVDFGSGAVPDSGSPESYPITAPASATELAAATPNFRLETVKEAMKTAHREPSPVPPPPYNWYFDETDTSVVNNYNVGAKQPLFFFLAALSNRHSFGYAAAEKLYRNTSILSVEKQIPMGTSVQVLANFNPTNTADPIQAATLSNTRLDGNATATPEAVEQFGFNPLYNGTEDALTIDETFYTKNPLIADPAAGVGVGANLDLDKANMTLDARQVTFTVPNANGSNAIALRINGANVRFDATATGNTGDEVTDYFDATDAPIPYYRLGALKIEGPTDPYNDAGEYTQLTAGMTMDIRAFCYAQEGSWMIVPGGYFDESTRSLAAGPIRLQADGTTPDTIDLNRDGVISREERIAPYRMRRYNYKVNLIGSIMENHTMPVLNEGSTVFQGSVNDWMDKWSVAAFDNDDAAQPDFDDAAVDGLNNANVKSNLLDPTRNFGNITYSYDPAMATFAAVVNDIGFRPPVSPDLIYTD